MIFVDESHRRVFFLVRKRVCSFLFPHSDFGQVTIHHDEIKDAFLCSMNYMNMNGFVLIGVKVEYKSKVLKNFLACCCFVLSLAKIQKK